MRAIKILLAASVASVPMVVALAAPASAQETTSSVRGTVEAAGAPVAGADVLITHTPSGTVARATTSADGSFSASGLRIGGPFTVEVTAPGFETAQVTDIFLTAGQPFRIPVELNATEIITVTASSVSGAGSKSQGPITTLGRNEIEGVASVNRDIRDMARRDPFVSIDASNARTIEIAGQNGRLNRFSVDGIQFSDDFGINNGGLPTSRGPVPFDAIEQMSVKIAPYDVSEGDFQGGAVNVVLRSGTNSFTGSAFYTYSNDSLTGDRIRGNPVNLDFTSKQYGGFLSGPIVKDKLFFAIAYEKLKESDPVDEGPAGMGFATEIPRLTQTAVDRISAIAQSAYGYDTLGVFQGANETDEKMTAKLDWNVSDDHRVSLTYIRNEGTQQFSQNMNTSNTGPTFGYRSNGYELTEEVNSGTFQLNSQWSDAFSTEFRAAYRDYNRGQTPFGDTSFGQIGVCLDETSVNDSVLGNTLTSCGNTSSSQPIVYFGPDVSRQANKLNTENLSIDLTARLEAGAHSFKFLVGYTDVDVFNLFLQRAKGEYYFDSIADFEAGIANRVRLAGAVPSGVIDDAAAQFSTQTYTFGLQDDWHATDSLRLSIGARYDLQGSNSRVPFNENFLARAGFSNTKTFKGMGVFQPRVGFDWQPTNRFVLRGGVGKFAGGAPDVFLSNSFSNTGQLTNAIDIRRNTSTAGCDVPAGPTAAALCTAALSGVDPSAFDPLVLDYLQTNTASLTAAPVNAIHPDYELPAQWRATLSANYDADFGALGDGWLLGADFVYGNTAHANTYYDARSVVIGTLPDGRPRYGRTSAGILAGDTNQTNQDLVLASTSKGRSVIAVGRVEKAWDFGLTTSVSYTFQDIKDVNPITSATAGSLYGNAAMADPNAADYGTSIYEVKHSLKFSVDYEHAFFGDYKTRFALFGEYRTGRPYSLTMRDTSTGRSPVFGTNGTNTRYLLYVPTASDPLVSFDSAATEAAFNAFIEDNGLAKYRGGVISKNTQRSPSFWKVDLHLEQEVPTFVGSSRVKLFADIENVLNMINNDWGAQRQQAFPYQSATVNVQCLAVATPTGTAGVANTASSQTCAQYRYSGFSEPNITVQNQNKQSLYQIRLGVKFEF